MSYYTDALAVCEKPLYLDNDDLLLNPTLGCGSIIEKHPKIMIKVTSETPPDSVNIKPSNHSKNMMSRYMSRRILE